MLDSFDSPKVQEINETDIGKICFDVYQKVARLLDKEVHKVTNMALCGWITDEIVTVLREKYPEYSIKKMQQNVYSAVHEFVEIEHEGDRYVLDATWQQFLFEKSPDKPSVMFVNRNYLSEKLDELGIPIDLHKVWLLAKEKIS